MCALIDADAGAFPSSKSVIIYIWLSQHIAKCYDFHSHSHDMMMSKSFRFSAPKTHFDIALETRDFFGYDFFYVPTLARIIL
jgi:hypothetical protein